MFYVKKMTSIKLSYKIIFNCSSVYLVHGPGPLPILKPQIHSQMFDHLKFISQKFPSPKAIILISAHWEQKQWTILDNNNPGLLYDYGNFPQEAFRLKHPAFSTQALRKQVTDHLESQNYKLKKEKYRGYDHGVFIPLMIAYPQANIPIIQISMLESLDPIEHFQMGKALKGLRSKGFMIMGSGSSAHGAFRQKGVVQKSKIFDDELADLCIQKYDQNHIKSIIKNWRKISYAEYLHPREEHLIPLFVNLGASSERNQVIQQKFFDQTMQLNLSNFIFL